MAQLNFREIAQLVALSKTTRIEVDKPKERAEGWELLAGYHRVHTSEYPFSVLSVSASATRDSLRRAEVLVAGDPAIDVVFAPSIEARVKGFRELFKGARNIWTHKEYLSSFIRSELDTYRGELRAIRPEHYEPPSVKVPAGLARVNPNPVRSFLTDKEVQREDGSGNLAIVLAEPGQGKTFMSRSLVNEVLDLPGNYVPLLIESAQWETIPRDDRADLSRTILHTFRSYRASIGWLEGNEDFFLRVMLKADLFRIVFDGFDEFVLRNRDQVEALDVLEGLGTLARETGSRIVLTSRTSFWNNNLPASELQDWLERERCHIYEIEPFSQEKARNYFTKRFASIGSRVDRAIQHWKQVESRSRDLAGRGFVLSLIADLAGEDGGNDSISGSSGGLGWLSERLCEREERRQQLPLSASDQMVVLREFAAEVAQGDSPNSSLLGLILETVRVDLEVPARELTLEKLRSHPLLRYQSTQDEWTIPFEPIATYMLATHMRSVERTRLSTLVGKLRLSAPSRQDLGIQLADEMVKESSFGQDQDAVADLITALTADVSGVKLPSLRDHEGARLAAIVALRVVERCLGSGSEKRERTDLLLRLTLGDCIQNLAFEGAISRFSFRGVTFHKCNFNRVTWANVEFDELSQFRSCAFQAGMSARGVEGLGAAVFAVDTILDPDAAQWLNAVRIHEDRRTYALDDLRGDFRSVVDKFIGRGGVGLRTLHERDLGKGPISQSRYRKEILEAVRRDLLETHHISGRSGTGLHIKEPARAAMQFYATNNSFTGPLRDCFERLVRTLLGTAS